MSRPSFIEPLMACSTAHLTPETMQRITDEEVPGIAYANEFGAFVYVPEAGEETEEGFPDDLVEVFALAREYDCFWIKFDRDAAEINALPVYDWDKAPCDHDWQSHPGVRGVCAKCGEER